MATAEQVTKARQVLRDPDTAEFAKDQLDILIGFYKAEADARDESGAKTMTEERRTALNRDIKRIRAIQKNLLANAERVRRSSEDEYADEL